MAWASVGNGGSGGSAAVNQSSFSIVMNGTAGSGLNVGELAVLCVAVDNFSSVSNADEGAVILVSDPVGNNWVKAAEITNGNSASTTGTVCSIWYSNIHAALSSAQAVAAHYSNSAARDRSALSVWRFSKGAGTVVRAKQTTYLTGATSVIGTVDLTEANQEFLRLRAVSARTTLTAMTTTAGWTAITAARASATQAEAIFGEWQIVTATTKGSSPSLTAAVANASVYVTFEEINCVAGQSL